MTKDEIAGLFYYYIKSHGGAPSRGCYSYQTLHIYHTGKAYYSIKVHDSINSSVAGEPSLHSVH